MKNISKEDFIIWDIKENRPLEGLGIVYHYTTIIELINSFQFSLGVYEEIICVAELPLKWQRKISDAIELSK